MNHLYQVGLNQKDYFDWKKMNIDERVNLFKRIESFRKKYGYDDCAFGLEYYPDGNVGIFSKIAASIPIGSEYGIGSLEKRLRSMWKDMIHILEINLDRMNPKSLWYKLNVEKENEDK